MSWKSLATLTVFCCAAYCSSQETGSVSVQGSCSASNSGNGSQVTVTCYGVDKELAQEIQQLVAESNRDGESLKEIRQKLNALLKAIKATRVPDDRSIRLGNDNQISNSAFITGDNPTVEIVSTPPVQAGLLMDCELAGFPMKIAAGSSIHVLRISDATLKRDSGFYDVTAPQSGERLWPSDLEAPPDNSRPPEETFSTFLGLKCTIRKYGGSEAVDDVELSFNFSGAVQGTYTLRLDPLDSGARFRDFTFYMVNCVYFAVASGGMLISGIPPVIANFPESGSLHVLGEHVRRIVPLKFAFRDNRVTFVFLMDSGRLWPDIPQ